MLIVNYKVLNPNTQDPELKGFQKEYERGVQELMTKFPSGNVQLKRNGYPKVSHSPDPNMLMQPEVPPPVYFKLKRTMPDGAYWAYCKGRADIQANGLADVPEAESTEVFDGEVVSLNVRNKPDYAFFIMYKSGIVGTDYSIFDPTGDKLRDLADKNAKLKVQFAIRETLTEEKLRMISQAWGLSGATKKDVLILQEELEAKVFKMEEHKRKTPTDLMAKGVAEFLAEIKNDDVVRPKAIIQMALDEKRLSFNLSNSHFYFDEADICYVPVDKQAERTDFLANTLRKPEFKEKWLTILKALVTKEYIESLDKYGKRWLATQFDIALNKSEDKLSEALLSEFAL